MCKLKIITYHIEEKYSSISYKISGPALWDLLGPPFYLCGPLALSSLHDLAQGTVSLIKPSSTIGLDLKEIYG